MKTILIFLFMAFISLCSGQNWELFPLNQKSYFQFTSADSKSYVEVVIRDSFFTSGSTEVSLFGTKFSHPGAGQCYGSLAESSENLVDSIFVSGDTTAFQSPYSDVIFFTKAPVGFSWLVNGYTGILITCTGIVADTVLANIDSVKTFSLQEVPSVSSQNPINDFSIRLSKNFGLIDFVRFSEMKDHILNDPFRLYSLIGMQNDSGDFGMVQKKFQDYYPYHPGDLLLWKLLLMGNHGYESASNMILDSITDIYSSGDSVAFSSDRIIVNKNGKSSYSTNVASLTLNSIGNMINSFPFTYSFNEGDFYSHPPAQNRHSLWYNGFMEVIADTVVGDKQIQKKFIQTGFDFDTVNCQFIDNNYSTTGVTVNDHFGIVDIDGGGTYFVTLIGARINGNVYGNLELPFTGYSSEKINSYPSPANSNVFFILEPQKKFNISIYDADGKLLLVNDNYFSSQEIDISNLTAGIYYAKIFSSDVNYYSVIIKI